MTILVTGAAGFIGPSLVSLLKLHVHTVICAVRHAQPDAFVHGSISELTDWSLALNAFSPNTCDVVVHLAARVHQINERASDPLAEYRRVNVAATIKLAQQAAATGTKRFIFLSTIKVNGEQTCPGQAFRSNDSPNPLDPYALSKWEAEQGLREIARQTGMEVVIIRPPLVYGPGVKSNFAAMVQWLQRGIPLPLGAIHNRRSLVALDNLVSLILTCIAHPAAANQTLLVSDGGRRFHHAVVAAHGRGAGVSGSVVAGAAKRAGVGLPMALGKQSVAQRLFGSLQVDMEPTRQLLGWTPPLSLDQGLLQLAQHVQKKGQNQGQIQGQIQGQKQRKGW